MKIANYGHGFCFEMIALMNRIRSSKDGGNKVTTINLLEDITPYRPLIDTALNNPLLVLS